MSLFDPLDHKVLLPEMEEIEGEPIIPQALFSPLGLPEMSHLITYHSLGPHSPGPQSNVKKIAML